MIKKELKRLDGLVQSLRQQTVQTPRLVTIKEYFPKENAVTIQLVGTGSEFGGVTPRKIDNTRKIDNISDFKFPLGQRGDVSESLAPQPGDTGLLFYSGFQYKTGFVLLTHTEGGDEAMAYVPIRGGWAVG